MLAEPPRRRLSLEEPAIPTDRAMAVLQYGTAGIAVIAALLLAVLH